MDQTEQEKLNQQIEELTLLILYITSWIERVPGFPEGIPRSWKGYPFDVLNNLKDKGYLCERKHPSKRKSVYLTDEGVVKAKELEKKCLK